MSKYNEAIRRDLNDSILARIDDYSAMLGAYLNDMSVDLNNDTEYNWYRRYARDLRQDKDLGIPPSTNVTKSVIDTLVANIATKKPHPFFNSINGSQDTKRVVEDIQQFFDIVYDNKHVHEKFIEAFTDACIFGIGYIFLNPFNYEIENLKTFQVGLLDAEVKYGNPTKMLIRKSGFPVWLLSQYGIKYKTDKTTVLFHEFIDTIEGKCEIWVDDKLQKTIPYKSDRLPFIPVYYNKPVVGQKTISVVEELEGIQATIDDLNEKVSTCAQAWPGTTTYVMEGSGIHKEDIDNTVGKVFSIKAGYNAGNVPPVVTVNSPILDPEARNLIEFYTRKAYEMVGVSELSAMGKTPANVDSGVMLRALSDSESDRLSRATNYYVNGFSELAQIMIDVLPEDEDVLPSSINTSSVKWKDVKKQRDIFKIQFAVVALKSRDVAEQAKYVTTLLNLGLIQRNEIGYYLDRPDMTKAISNITALYNGLQQVIYRAMEYGEYDIPDFVEKTSLWQAITREQNILYSQFSDDKKGNERVELSLQRLMMLEDNLITVMKDEGLIATEPALPEQKEVNNGEAEALVESNPIIDEESESTNNLTHPEGDF